jgi:hypothetical protein
MSAQSVGPIPDYKIAISLNGSYHHLTLGGKISGHPSSCHLGDKGEGTGQREGGSEGTYYTQRLVWKPACQDAEKRCDNGKECRQSDVHTLGCWAQR